MEMTIDESLEWLISRKEHYEMDDNCQELAQALDTATDIMRKYQKIEKIVNKWHQDPEVKDFDCMAEVADVFEDFEEGGGPLWYQVMDLD